MTIIMTGITTMSIKSMAVKKSFFSEAAITPLGFKREMSQPLSSSIAPIESSAINSRHEDDFLIMIV